MTFVRIPCEVETGSVLCTRLCVCGICHAYLFYLVNFIECRLILLCCFFDNFIEFLEIFY